MAPDATQGPVSGTIVDMGSGEQKDASTGASRGNKKKQKVTNQQLLEMLEKYRQINLNEVSNRNEVMKEVAKHARQSGLGGLADSIEGVKPKGLWASMRVRLKKTVVSGDTILVVVGTSALVGLVYQGVAYVFRHQVALPTPIKFNTGKAADRRMANAMQVPGGRARATGNGARA